MKNRRRHPDPEKQIPLGVLVAAWIAGAWALALGAFFFTLWLAAQGAE